MTFDRSPLDWIDERIPAFTPRIDSRYDRDFSVVDVYTGIAFGHRLFADGSAEGLYRTMSALVLASPVQNVLDLGCGVGRLLYDCAAARPEALFTGVDQSYNMCRRSTAILNASEAIPLPGLERWGRPGVTFDDARRLPNVTIAQASALDLPFAPATFDTVVATLLLCRLPDPLAALAQMVRVLRPHGRLLLATPCGFNTAAPWETFVPAHRFREHLALFGLRIDEWFENLSYRELIDAHGNAHDWRVRIVAATSLV